MVAPWQSPPLPGGRTLEGPRLVLAAGARPGFPGYRFPLLVIGGVAPRESLVSKPSEPASEVITTSVGTSSTSHPGHWVILP